MSDNTFDVLRQAVWNEMYTNMSASIYFEELLKRRKIWNWSVRIFTVCLAVLAIVVNSIEQVEFIYRVVSFLPFFGFSFMDFKLNFLRIDSLRNIRRGCLTVGSMLDSLWNDINLDESIDNLSTYRSKFSQIVQVKDILVNNRYIEEDLTENEQLNLKSTEKAHETMINLYEGVRV